MALLCTYREPFGFSPHVRRIPEGGTLEQMRAQMPVPDDFDARGVICINGHPVPRAVWGMIRPKSAAVTEVTFHLPPQGGGGDSGKNVFATIASIALTVVSGGIAASGWLQAGAWFKAGSVSAIALAAGVSLAGSLLISALVPYRRGLAINSPGSWGCCLTPRCCP